MSVCVYARCKNSECRNPDKVFHRFPPTNRIGKNRLNQWITNCGNPALLKLSKQALRNKVICCDHFRKDCYSEEDSTVLRFYAVPEPSEIGVVNLTVLTPSKTYRRTKKKDNYPEEFTVGSDPIRPDSPATSDNLQSEAVEQSSDDSEMASGKKWRESDTIKFVELYEKAECLWNFRHPGYKHRNARDKAIQHIIEQMNLPDFGVNELKNKIKNIRSTYQQEVNKIRRSKEGCTDILEEYKTNLAWFPIAERFLSGVINSAKNPLPKTEEEDPSFFQATQPALYNLVETEMINGDLDNEVEEKFTPFPLSIDQIKEEIENDDYNTSSVTHYSKKRKLSHQPSAYEGSEYKSEEIETYHHSLTDDLPRDEWYHFGNNISCQLRNLPVEVALLCQKKIVDILTQERIDYIMRLKNEGKNNANNE